MVWCDWTLDEAPNLIPAPPGSGGCSPSQPAPLFRFKGSYVLAAKSPRSLSSYSQEGLPVDPVSSKLRGAVNGSTGWPLSGDVTCVTLQEPAKTISATENTYRIHVVVGTMTGTKATLVYPVPPNISGSYEHIIINQTNGMLLCRPVGGLTTVTVPVGSGSLAVFTPTAAYNIRGALLS